MAYLIKRNRSPCLLPLAEGRIPVPIQAEIGIQLLVIKNLRNVNAENQQLEVGAKGLTTVYGGNGSGKSGG